jgi:hypothetical protein
MNKHCRTTAWLALALAGVVSSGCGGLGTKANQRQGADSLGCAATKGRLATLVDADKRKSSMSQLQDLLRFFDSVPDDPEDCVHSEVRRRIAVLEQTLVTLRVAGESLHPQKVLHCGAIDPGTERCEGPELDDTPLVDDRNLIAPSQPLPRNATSAKLEIAPKYRAEIVGVYAGERGNLQDGGRPVRIPHHENIIQLGKVSSMTGPILIVILHGDDSLRFRKFVWTF